MFVIEEWQGQDSDSALSIATPVQIADYNQAEGEYLIKQGYACMSSVPYHMVRLSNFMGEVIMQKCYTPDRFRTGGEDNGND